MFSRRTAFDLTRNRLALLLDEKRGAGTEILDLTESNPTRCGFASPGREALDALADERARRYEPSAKGRDDARGAIVQAYAERGVTLDPERLVLAASTSEAYGWLFKLLADPGDEALVPRPSYPLLDFLAALEGVRLRRYRLEYDRRWSVDVGAVRAAIGRRTRALVLVSPNNPTGSVVTEAELEALDALAGEQHVAVVADEVFGDFPFDPAVRPPVAAARARAALTFSLSGLSKACGLPQLKLAWIVLGGPDAVVRTALARLELVADTYLSVSTPVQTALPRLLAGRHAFQDECRARLRANRALLEQRLAAAPAVQLLAADGGWSACLRVPRVRAEEELVLELLRDDSVAVHPGYFFDFADEAYLVLSLLVPTATLDRGLARILAKVGGAA